MQVVPTDRTGPISVTHQHLLTAIGTMLAEGRVRPQQGRLRLLDIGCGDGQLIAFLQDRLTRAYPGLEIEFHGFDIGEQGYNDGGQFDIATQMLTARHPGIPWRERISLISDAEPWRYPSGYFDIALSNQVMEHVADLPGFLSELHRCLSPAGVSLHLFPLAESIVEAHCQTPFAHWIRDFDRRVDWISLLSRLGIGAYRRHRKVLGHATAHQHAVETAKYIQCWTSYRSFSAIADQCSQAGLAASSGLTKGFFIAKLRSVLKMRPLDHYRRSRIPGIDWLGFVVGRYLSSSTLVIMPVDYDIGRRIAAEKAASNLRKAA
ncbi:MAG: class I SAM-dependent methyltransferase [Sphingobium sp.]